jgi:hypothetical protein
VFRVNAEAEGRPVKRTHEANPGEVWEENEFWIDLSWAIDPDGSLGIRSHFESIEQPGQRLSVDEYYAHLFGSSVPGLPEAAAEEGLSPLEYMRKYGAFQIASNLYDVHERELEPGGVAGEVEGTRRGLPRAGHRRHARRAVRHRRPHAVHR